MAAQWSFLLLLLHSRSSGPNTFQPAIPNLDPHTLAGACSGAEQRTPFMESAQALGSQESPARAPRGPG